MKSRNAFQNPIENKARKQHAKAPMQAAAANPEAGLFSCPLQLSIPDFRHEAKLTKLMLNTNAAARNSPGLKSSWDSAVPGFAGMDTGSHIINRDPLENPDSSLIIKKSTKKSLPHQLYERGQSLCRFYLIFINVQNPESGLLKLLDEFINIIFLFYFHDNPADQLICFIEGNE
jgi:hypothetical protein